MLIVHISASLYTSTHDFGQHDFGQTMKISVDLSIKLEPVFIKSSTFRHLLGRSIWLWERKNTRYVMIDLLKFCLWAITFG